KKSYQVGTLTFSITRLRSPRAKRISGTSSLRSALPPATCWTLVFKAPKKEETPAANGEAACEPFVNEGCQVPGSFRSRLGKKPASGAARSDSASDEDSSHSS